MDRFPKKQLLTAGIIIGLTLALGWGGFDQILKGTIKLQTRLINGTTTWKLWETIPAPIKFSVYIFNITNPVEMANGEKAKVKQMGPYIFTETLLKIDIDQEIDNDTISYRQLKFYNFQPDISIGRDDEMITTLNAPFVILAKTINDMTEDDSILALTDKLMTDEGESITIKASISEIIFGGFEIKNYLNALNHPTLKGISNKAEVPENMQDGKYAFFKDKNGTDDGEWVIRSGWNKTATFGEMCGWNGMDNLTYWKGGGVCNQVKGTDGIIFRPFITGSDNLDIYHPELCRSITYNTSEYIREDDVTSYRFKMLRNTLYDSDNNEENECFCIDKDPAKCKGNGKLDLSSCMEGSPYVFSQPHFLNADPEIKNGVSGMQPNPQKHETFFDIEPLTGLNLRSAKRFQYGMQLETWSKMPTFSKLTRAVIPLYWIEETFETDEKHKNILRFISFADTVWNHMKIGLLAIGFLILFLGIAIACTRRNRKTEDKVILVK